MYSDVMRYMNLCALLLGTTVYLQGMDWDEQLFLAVQENNGQDINCAVDNGAKLDSTSKDSLYKGMMPLRHAILSGEDSLVRLLLTKGALAVISSDAGNVLLKTAIISAQNCVPNRDDLDARVAIVLWLLAYGVQCELDDIPNIQTIAPLARTVLIGCVDDLIKSSFLQKIDIAKALSIAVGQARQDMSIFLLENLLRTKLFTAALYKELYASIQTIFMRAGPLALSAEKRGEYQRVWSALEQKLGTALYSKQIDAIKEPDKALFYGVLANDSSVVEDALLKGANVASQDKQGNTPLHLAVAYGNEAIVRLLLECDAPKRARNNYGRTPLDIARARGYKKEFVYQLMTPRQCIFLAAYYGDTEIVRTVMNTMSEGFSVSFHATDKYQRRTPLHVAAQQGHDDMMRLLLFCGANPNVVDSYKQTPLHYLIRYIMQSGELSLPQLKKFKDLITLFITFGACPALPDRYGTIPEQYLKDLNHMSTMPSNTDTGSVPLLAPRAQATTSVTITLPDTHLLASGLVL